EDVSGGIKYGVAPGAKWIAVRMFNTSGSASEENTIKCFQWLADPDGNSSTSDDVPDILNNSWGATTAYGGGVCDSSYYTYIDNCEAAGCVLFFSAGNSGPGSKTIGSPASRITSAINAFAVGAVDSANTIADFSSRGPSTCGTGTTIKPEVSAPGVQVWSVAGDGNTGYKYGDGTSMACPHVAGAAALLLQAKPSASVNDIKNALYNTAVYGPGQREEDNNYGKGVIDVYAAYQLLGGSATPDITYDSNYIDDSGDHYAAPGETFYFRVTLKNNGGGATGVSATLSESDSYVTLNDSYATFSDIGHNATGTCNSPYYRVAINAGCPAGHTVNFTLNVSADGSYSKSVGFSIVVGIPSENTFTSSDTPKVIPDNSASGVNSSQDLSNVGAVSEVNVYCDITHTYIGDLIVKVISPEGTEATLHNKGGGSADNIVTWYNTNTLEAGPGKLDDFIGENGSGIWKLFASDNAGQDTGQINSWKLEITSYGQPSDAVPPADISDLSASTGEAIGAVNLSWTSPGDDGSSDTATRYIIKYNTVNITDGNWTSSSALSNLPAPKIGGSSENLTVTGLTEGQLYYFAIKTEDEVPNSSGLSNVSSATAKAASAILLVDDDNGATSESYYKTALTNGGFTYDYWNVKNSGSPASSKLSQYQTVIWFTAADYQTTLTSTDESNLISYLNSGGHLLFVSQDYLYQLTGGTSGNITQNFAHNYLKVNS
ncbi:S8 family serine peptidase, partial [bacterium]|nr:S8 family serine peptidase [bacterium]